MGMLMRRHCAGPDEPETPEPVDPYEGLTDDEVFDAYVTNVDGDAESREDMVAELRALDAEASEGE